MRNPMLIVALGLGAVAAIGTFFFVSKKTAKKQKEVKPKAEFNQVVAKEPLYPHQRVTAEMVTTEKTDKLDPTVCENESDVIDHVVLEMVDPGEKVFKYNVSGIPGRTTTKVVSFEVPPMKRAFAIVIDPSEHAGGLAHAGDHVDVLVTYEWGDREMCRTVVQNVEVLATQRLGEQPKAAAEGEEGKEAAPPTAPPEESAPAVGSAEVRIVLSVDPEEVQQIIAAGEKGSLSLVIRNVEDQEIVELEESYEQPMDMKSDAELEEAQSAQAAPRAARSFADAMKSLAGLAQPTGPLGPGALEAKPATKQVEIIRAGQRETVTVPEE